MYRILAINPGSTSTKIAVFEDTKEIFITTLRHSSEEIQGFERITDQFEFRKDIIINELKNANIDVYSLDIIVGRGGLVKPIPSGVYEVNDALKHDLIESKLGEHASNLGGLIAADIANEINKHHNNDKVKAVIVDPVVVDEMQDIARVSGHPLFERVSIFHALNQKAIGREHAKKLNQKYEDLNLIIAHLGGGISVGAHQKGKVIDVNNALDGEGPFSPERSGTLPTGQLSKLCFSGKYTQKEIKEIIKGKGGLVGHLGTNNTQEVGNWAKEGNEKAQFILDAMCYQIGKEIGSAAAVLKGKVDGILITGGIAHSKDVVKYIAEMVGFIAPVVAYPGEDEMAALALNAYFVFTGELPIQTY
ncbi:butyrate kinase [Bacteroidales bacterium OttesenSCG-928-K03]|nr:butyrate kinase [Odoribacter sp. OttesenSCG-928-L07]MDL2239704.1 butyrate kinase [Bacteroidales bacterium OttesenSCG-928-L14]MDL2240805.1 butyrate kinase [Bacteroidales bacterium OttesenSCG-928-K22]MDL2242780.1 butyrate kinase [Bacteroidales bacterium OttesenSCG-928-K03]